MPTLIVATGNPGKLAEMQAYLDRLDCQLALKPPEIEVEESGSTFYENACLKASQVAKALNQWAIADDSGLAVDALDGAPGLYSARYGNTDGERITKLLQAMEGVTQRQAQFICVVAIAAPDGSIQLSSEGICPGEITHSPRGNHGFGYDPIFWLPRHKKTFAEMTKAEKRQVSHRGQAFDKLIRRWSGLEFDSF
ncbi:RdgB/HAM1 family non-canonical purine NTP pyrophosphatase [Synechocystis sp. FACHB-383]|uniref:RdgB/HAM1 family non-canonical purine NTP pyrophosphatase n=1 Tax=Synechocystis sp. FACHB-383 TaxID=2692864 RepID=UPI0016860D6F|nr:RdgB/HAM1 family non-canonical purine NTP pyrophosphatase [Synechocystis sp. FACHB-383]MBD2652082.1 RdgB/HAM1 family non-canonical purine NTP pyrophosphatase [Synechocystis sp. FACHB-383]